MKIDRTLFWFKKGAVDIVELNRSQFGLGLLMNRLLNKEYDGKRIKFINLDFATPETYQLFPMLPKNKAYYYGGHLRFYGVFDYAKFDLLDNFARKQMIWDCASYYLGKAANSIGNKKLAESVKMAQIRGVELNLNPDYRMIEKEVLIEDQPIKIAVWVKFEGEMMCSVVTIEKEEVIIFEKNIDKTESGTEFFLEMYHQIELTNNTIIIKGHKDVDYLPLRIPVEEYLTNHN